LGARQARNSLQGFSLRLNQGQSSQPFAAAFPLRPAEIAAKLPKRLHPVSVFADYRKAANNDGFAALWVAAGADSVEVSAIGNHDKNDSLFGPQCKKLGII
jgi:hypothetical protein